MTTDDPFVKHYPSPQAATRALARTRAAAKAGVMTPPVRGAEGPHALRFDRISADGTPTLDEMLRALSPLHRMPHEGMARLDPFHRIRTRLDRTGSALGRMANRLAAQDDALRWPEDAVVHGDFHPGQVIRDQAGRVWLVDLDDLARGPREADLGNLAAWLCTQDPGPLDVMADQALSRVLSAAPWADAAMARHFRDIALVRRALKLRERSVGWVFDQLSLRA